MGVDQPRGAAVQRVLQHTQESGASRVADQVAEEGAVESHAVANGALAQR